MPYEKRLEYPFSGSFTPLQLARPVQQDRGQTLPMAHPYWQNEFRRRPASVGLIDRTLDLLQHKISKRLINPALLDAVPLAASLAYGPPHSGRGTNFARRARTISTNLAATSLKSADGSNP